jgi:hypothetical protein
MRFEKGERFIAGVAFKPEGHATQLNRQRVLIDAVDAVGDHITHAILDGFGRRFIGAGAQSRQLFP